MNAPPSIHVYVIGTRLQGTIQFSVPVIKATAGRRRGQPGVVTVSDVRTTKTKKTRQKKQKRTKQNREYKTTQTERLKRTRHPSIPPPLQPSIHRRKMPKDPQHRPFLLESSTALLSQFICYVLGAEIQKSRSGFQKMRGCQCGWNVFGKVSICLDFTICLCIVLIMGP